MARAFPERERWVQALSVLEEYRMNAFRTYHYAAGRWMGSALAALLFLLLRGVTVGAEEKLDLLQIGTRTYTNVTVTTKAKNYIFIVHAGGMASIKTADLSLGTKQQLGYAPAGAPRAATNTAAVWAKREFAKVNVLPFTQLSQKWGGKPSWALFARNLLASKVVFVVLGIGLLIYLLHCYCCMLICRKTGNPPGVLVWLPVLQLFPLLRAAGMSGWWFLAYCVPVLNIVAQVLWCLNIAKARGHGAWVGVLLFLPITYLFAFLYLTFSKGALAEEEDEPEPKIMTLEAA
jgi:hypothetical protein